MFDLKRWFSPAKNPVAAPGPQHLLAIVQESDDSAALRQIAAGLGWSISIVASSAGAITILQRQPVPVVICDRDLPGEDWREVLRRISALPQSVCVLLASRVMDDYLWNEVIQCHGYDVIRKPFQAEELRRIVSFACRSLASMSRATGSPP